ncbi:HD domain-containing protein [Desulfolutivibrio sp.]|uniref:HD domain-containing protein n=1 Tax=Desulfolutivibrio sp. TaxID=2773296 RepID=UPI002F96354A
MDIYLVGGAVRDLILGRAVTDRDYLVLGAEPDEFVRRHPTARQVGKSFPVFLQGGSQYAWPRGGSLASDLAARDLTINAMALGVSPGVAGRVAAHPLAFPDLGHRILRPCSPASLADDPARIFRAARFAAQLPDFSPHPGLVADMAETARMRAFSELSPERAGGEVQKALAAPRPGRFLALLNTAKSLDPWFRELRQADGVPAGPLPWHDKSVLGHTIQVMDRLAGDPLAVWMALCHDLGKTITPQETWPRHLGHDTRGEAMALELGARLRLPGKFLRAGALACRLHMKAGRYMAMRPGPRVDLLDRLWQEGLFDEMFSLAAADHQDDAEKRLQAARRDLDAMLAVHLPEPLQNLGPASGEKLRQLRCMALADLPAPL